MCKSQKRVLYICMGKGKRGSHIFRLHFRKEFRDACSAIGVTIYRLRMLSHHNSKFTYTSMCISVRVDVLTREIIYIYPKKKLLNIKMD